MVDAYRRGTGLSFGGYGDEIRIGQGLLNRAGFLGPLTQEWVPGDARDRRAPRPPGGGRPRRGVWRGLVDDRPRPGVPRPHGGGRRQRRGLDHGCASPRRPGRTWPGGSGSRWARPTRPPRPVRRTWCSSSRRCTTWPIRSRRSPARERRCGPGAASSSSTRTSSTRSRRTDPRWSACSSRRASCTASRSGSPNRVPPAPAR